MTIRNDPEIDDIDLRMNFVKANYDGKVPLATAAPDGGSENQYTPPPAMANTPSSAAVRAAVRRNPPARPMRNAAAAAAAAAAATTTGGNGGKPFLKANTIAAPKDKRHLMRQVSALGMEDPVFGTVEEVPQHPSNIFDDMSVGDIPQDMRDLMSVASDPTADGNYGNGNGNGIDAALYQSLNFAAGDLEGVSKMEFNMPPLRQNSKKKAAVAASLTGKSLLLGKNGSNKDKKDDDKSDASSISFELDFPPVAKVHHRSKNNTNEDNKGNGTSNHDDVDKGKEQQSCQHQNDAPSASVRKSSKKMLEQLEASVQSLRLEDVANAVDTPPQSPTTTNNNIREDKEHEKSKRSLTTTLTNPNNMSMAEKAQRLVSPRKNKSTSSSSDHHRVHSPRKNKSSGSSDHHHHHRMHASTSNLSNHKNRSNARLPQRQRSDVNPDDVAAAANLEAATVLMLPSQQQQKQKQKARHHQELQQMPQFHQSMQEFTCSGLGRGDSIYQPINSEMYHQIVAAAKKESSTNDGDDSNNSNSMEATPPPLSLSKSCGSSSTDMMMPHRFHQSMQEFTRSSLPRGDSIYQPINSEMYNQIMAASQKESDNKNSKDAVPPPLSPSKSGGSSSTDMMSTPMAKSRAMPNLNSIFPTGGNSNNSRRMRARRQRVPQTSSSNV